MNCRKADRSHYHRPQQLGEELSPQARPQGGGWDRTDPVGGPVLAAGSVARRVLRGAS